MNDLIDQLLEYDPEKRLSAEDVLKHKIFSQNQDETHNLECSLMENELHQIQQETDKLKMERTNRHDQYNKEFDRLNKIIDEQKSNQKNNKARKDLVSRNLKQFDVYELFEDALT